MLRLNAERRSLSQVSGAHAAESRITKTTDNSYPTTETAPPHTPASDRRPHTPVHFPVSTSNAAAWALFTLVVGTILIVACVLLTLGAPS